MPYNLKPKLHSGLRNGKVNDLIFSVTLRSAQTKANKELSKNKASCNNSERFIVQQFGCPCNKVEYNSMLFSNLHMLRHTAE